MCLRWPRQALPQVLGFGIDAEVQAVPRCWMVPVTFKGPEGTVFEYEDLFNGVKIHRGRDTMTVTGRDILAFFLHWVSSLRNKVLDFKK